MKKILVIGDVMLDKYSYGDVRRLNPEGPNPLLNITFEKNVLGGAANVAANIASLAGECDLIGMVGNDNNYLEMQKLFQNNNIKFFPIFSGNETITKHRFVDNTYKQQLLRIDYEKYTELSDEGIEFIKKIILEKNYEIIVISDYEKGMIVEKLVNFLKNLSVKILVDAKPKNYHLFDNVFLLKPNFKEFSEFIGLSIENTNENIEKYGKKLIEKMNANFVVTRGSYGATLIEKNGEITHMNTKAKDVFDVTGAGDTFIATIAFALEKNYSLKDSIILGNKASGIVVGKVGTAIISYSELFEKGK